MDQSQIEAAAHAIKAASAWQEGEGQDFPPGATPPAKAMKLGMVSPSAVIDSAIVALKEVQAVYLPMEARTVAATIQMLEFLKTLAPV
jgi:hypothetical protein